MPQNNDLASETWSRYAFCRDNGHQRFVEKSDQCRAFFRGEQWSAEDMAMLRAQRRPALTINKIISTMSNIMGEQIYNRSEINFRPRGDANPATADILTKLYKVDSDRNQLDWKRSDMFADGILTSRGFLDMRVEFGKNMQGDIVIKKLNPKNVILDPDGDDADPDTWSEVFTTGWLTADDICVIYDQTDGDALRNKTDSYFPYGYDSIDSRRDRFGGMYSSQYGNTFDDSNVTRSIRVIERQYRKLDRQAHFVDQKTGAMRPVPDEWTAQHAKNVASAFGLQITKKLVRRIRWTTIADNIVLHDDWSPYKHFTVIPYFPFFDHGHTIGLAENLLSSQELLNKTSSQELHIVNTTANSGWKIKAGSLVNMSVEELEQKGAQTGLVIELDEIANAEKITPNQTPTGLDRISYKAEDHIKSISGITDSRMGDDREDVAAKAISLKQRASNVTLAKPLDGLVRTDFYIARNYIDLVQEFYTEHRVYTMMHPDDDGKTDTFQINQPTPEGYVVNDLTAGEYDVVIGSVPVRETLEDSQFEQALAMRKEGIQIPDNVLIKSSRLMDKNRIIEQMEAEKNSQAAQQQAQLAMQQQQAEVARTQAEVDQKQADAALKKSKTRMTDQEVTDAQNTPPGSPDPAQMAEAQQKILGHQHNMAMAQEKHVSALELSHQAAAHKQQLDREQAAQKALTERLARVNPPTKTQPGAPA